MPTFLNINRDRENEKPVVKYIEKPVNHITNAVLWVNIAILVTTVLIGVYMINRRRD